MPTDQAATASRATSSRPDDTWGSTLAAAAATDWLATTQMNHVPLTCRSTGRSSRARTAAHGTP